MVKLLRRGERPPRGRPPERGPGLGIRPSSRTAVKDELMMKTSWFSPHANGGLALNHRPQLILTRRGPPHDDVENTQRRDVATDAGLIAQSEEVQMDCMGVRLECCREWAPERHLVQGE